MMLYQFGFRACIVIYLIAAISQAAVLEDLHSGNIIIFIFINIFLVIIVIFSVFGYL